MRAFDGSGGILFTRSSIRMKIVRRLSRSNIGLVISLAFPSMPGLSTHAHDRIATIHVEVVGLM
jgi:hypothetical protein